MAFFSANLAFSGTAREPALDGNFNIEDAAYTDFRFSKAQGNLNYADKLVTTKRRTSSGSSRKFSLECRDSFQLEYRDDERGNRQSEASKRLRPNCRFAAGAHSASDSGQGGHRYAERRASSEGHYRFSQADRPNQADQW